MGRGGSWRGALVHTIGHSTRALDELVALLRAFGVRVLVDVRTVPRSRHNPQFDREALRSALRLRRLRYVHIPELGGLRRPRKDSLNTAWRNSSFRGFADYMQTPDFEAGLDELHALLSDGPVALMCAEAVPWRCHRSLIADSLTARGARVEHIISAKHSTPHRLTAFAEVRDTRVTYPGEAPELERLDTRGPFHLEATVRVLQRRPTNLVDVWDQRRYLRVLTIADELILVEVIDDGTIDDPKVRFRVLDGDDSLAARAAVAPALRTILGLDLDPRPLTRILEGERRLEPVAGALRGMRPPRFPGLFETFANVIPFQQVSLEAGVAIVGRLVQRFGRSLVHGGQRRHAFPTARALANARLDSIRACGLSARKAAALRGVARALETGGLSEAKLARLSSPEASRLLTELEGIGAWSAGLVLLRGLGRLDVFPTGDVGAVRGLSRLMNLRPGPTLERVIRRSGDLRGYLYFCALGGGLLAKGLIHAAPS